MYPMVQIAIVLRCSDDENRIIIFEASNYNKHKRRHPELEQDSFFPDRVKNALRKPDKKMSGYKNNTRCYYVEEYAINGIIKYTKVVVHDSPRKINGEIVYCIKTAHKTDHIQELKYLNQS